MTLSPHQQRQLLDLSRCVIRRTLGDGSAQEPAITDQALEARASCFVSLHNLDDHHLRGCIGQIRADGPLKQCVIEMSEGVLDDRRFRSTPVQLDELSRLELEITVLSPLEQAAGPLDFDLLEHGIYLKCAGQTGCFLPQVARQTRWSKEQLLNRLCQEKMDLEASAWQRPEARLYRFTTLIVGPEPFVK